MQVTTRFAPTISGDLHLGSLYNALVNYLMAKQHADGVFKLRIDSTVLTEQRKIWQEGILADLDVFGLVPDEIIKSSDRLEYYREKGKEMLQKHPRSYYCGCTVQDLLKRARDKDENFFHLYRYEKYPPHCRVAQIQVFGVENDDNIAAGKPVNASFTSSKSSPASILTCRVAKNNQYWEPVDSGYMFHPIEPHVTIDLGEVKDIRGIEIVWKDRPVLKYKVEVVDGPEHIKVVENVKPGKYHVDVRPGQPHVPLTSDKQSFATTRGRWVKVTFQECPKPVDRPYFYDYHCRDGKEELDLMHRDTTMRLKNHDWYATGTYQGPKCFVTGEAVITRNDPKVDTCWWFGKEPDLVFTSTLDDHELGITHLLRGVDIRPFCVIESQVAHALKMLIPDQTYHGLILNEHGYKYGKFVESTPIREYLTDGVTPDMITTYLAYSTGLIKTLDRVLSPSEIAKVFDQKKILIGHVSIDEQVMLKKIRHKFLRKAEVNDG